MVFLSSCPYTMVACAHVCGRIYTAMCVCRRTVVMGVDVQIGIVGFDCQCLGTNRPAAGRCQSTRVPVLNVGVQLS